MCGIPLEDGGHIFQKETDSLPAVTKGSKFLCFYTHVLSRCWNSVWLELAQVLHMLSQLLWINVCNVLYCSQKTLLVCHQSLPLALSIFPLLLSRWSQSPGQKRCEIDWTFHTKNFVVSFPWNFDQLWTSVLITIYLKTRLLYWGLRDVLICGSNSKSLERA